MESNQDTGQIADSERGELIEKMVLDIMHRQSLTKMADVVSNLQKFDKFLTTHEIHDAARRLERRGEINLSEENITPSFFRNLADFEANSHFWIAIFACSAMLVTAFLLPADESSIALKRVSSAVFLVAVPGYVMTNAFIARNRLSYVERIAVSIGLSLATVALVGMTLAYGISGIRLEPITGSLAVVIIALAFVGAYRDFARRHHDRLMHHKFLVEHKGSS